MSEKLPAIKPKKLIKILVALGFEFYRQSGSHMIYVKDKYQVVIPYHNKDLKKGTLVQIIKGTGLSIDEIKQLM